LIFGKFWKFVDYQAGFGWNRNSKVVLEKVFLKFCAIFSEFSSKLYRKTAMPLEKLK
jgi:hypothetical protein